MKSKPKSSERFFESALGERCFLGRSAVSILRLSITGADKTLPFAVPICRLAL